MVSLQIKRHNLDLILAGSKKTEWREASLYNKRLLFKERADGKREGNSDIKEIQLINGYKKDRRSVTVEVKQIRLVKFSRNIEILEDNFKALEGQFSIEITLGDIINT